MISTKQLIIAGTPLDRVSANEKRICLSWPCSALGDTGAMPQVTQRSLDENSIFDAKALNLKGWYSESVGRLLLCVACLKDQPGLINKGFERHC